MDIILLDDYIFTYSNPSIMDSIIIHRTVSILLDSIIIHYISVIDCIDIVLYSNVL